jgi:hypothetical protein
VRAARDHGAQGQHQSSSHDEMDRGAAGLREMGSASGSYAGLTKSEQGERGAGLGELPGATGTNAHAPGGSREVGR